MTDNPLVTIGIPVYNGENFLAEAIESFLAQTFTDFELILSDNCSTDATQAICERYAAQDARIRYVRNSENIGANRNYNQIVPMARGKYFKWAAHDDLHAPDYLAKCVAVLEADESVVLCHTATKLIDENGDDIPMPTDGKAYVYDNNNNVIYVGMDPKNRRLDSVKASERFYGIVMQTNWNYEIFGLMRLAALVKTGLQPLFYGGDKVLLAELITHGRYVVLDEPLFLNRRHPHQSLSLSTLKDQEKWVNPYARRPGLTHRWLRLKGYVHAAFVAGNLPLRERLGCIWIVTRYYVRPARALSMLEDISGLRRWRIARGIRRRQQHPPTHRPAH